LFDAADTLIDIDDDENRIHYNIVKIKLTINFSSLIVIESLIDMMTMIIC